MFATLAATVWIRKAPQQELAVTKSGYGAAAKRAASARWRRISKSEHQHIVERIRAKRSDAGVKVLREGEEPRESPRLPVVDKHLRSGDVLPSSLRGPIDITSRMASYAREQMRAIVPLLAECYELALVTSPELEGDVMLHFTVEGDPEVGGVITAQ